MPALDYVAALVVASSFVLLFAGAGVHKLIDPQRFRGALEAYRILPERLVAPVALALPCAELACAAGLLLPALRTAGALGGALLLLSYAAGMALNLARGRREVDCGCMGFGRGQRLSGALVLRNLLLAGGLVVLAAGAAPARPLGATDWLTLAAATAVVALLYASIDGLLALPRRPSGHAVPPSVEGAPT